MRRLANPFQGSTYLNLACPDKCRADVQLEYVLEYVVERKRVDDLAASIRDARFRKQKAAMTRCGARCLLYLVEGLPESASTACTQGKKEL